nr:ribonuclease H-like domain, reverse transcriptase, RNA-dependent DNA polymerase [Tanacetum cinerariifolium]
MPEPMTSQSAFSFPGPSLSSTQQATFTSFSPGQTYITPEPSLPEDHMADFHHLDNAREIWLAVKARIGAITLLLQSLPEDHMADFHHLDNAREIWLAVKARIGDHAGNAIGSVYDAADEFAMMGISRK